MLLGRSVIIGLLLAAAALTAAAGPADDPELAEGIVSVSVNLEPKGDAYVLIGKDGEILMRESDLKAYGLSGLAYRPTRIDGVAYVALRDVTGLSYRFDEDKLTLRIRVQPREISRRQVIDMAPKRAADVVLPVGRRRLPQLQPDRKRNRRDRPRLDEPRRASSARASATTCCSPTPSRPTAATPAPPRPRASTPASRATGATACSGW